MLDSRVCISPIKMLCSHEFLFPFGVFFWTLGCTCSPPESVVIQEKWGIGWILEDVLLSSRGYPADWMERLLLQLEGGWLDGRRVPVASNPITILAHDGRKRCYQGYFITLLRNTPKHFYESGQTPARHPCIYLGKFNFYGLGLT